MPRSRQSAKQAGSRFERSIADYLKEVTGDDSIDRLVRRGSKDCGDIANVKIHGHRIALELKDVAKTDLPGWTNEAKVEAKNYGALAGFVISKRRGTTDPSKQWVFGTVSELVALITGEPQEGQ
ncbi:MAG: hypothetical protein A4E20_11080 [Nitrospira sp. SG-bin2]|uniref:hypothetical protein n=1 Tax=Nitrospira cf. moscoviensis SBR1015 TaxID=96242 RepID=UPI000A09A6D7|nr:hypothetical protein [Nitrospira cf. moscoviensis SBR1015]OQW34555.1 MAG: hypothetical protein A4E20_11080 [Nitrospira sp. SG-bin2]